MSNMFPFPSNMISKQFNWYSWFGAFGRWCMITSAYIILINTPTAQERFSHNYILVALGLCSIFHIGYMTFELIRPNNLSFWIITESADEQRHDEVK